MYTPLTPEQFNKAHQAGFSTDQITQMELKRKSEQGGQVNGFPTEEPAHIKQSFMQRVGHALVDPLKTGAHNVGAVGNALTSSEQTLGKGLSTVGSSIPKQVSDINAQSATDIANIAARAHTETDPVKKQKLVDFLNRALSGNADPKYHNASETNANVAQGDINQAFDLSDKQVIGAAAGTALDIASAGSYGEVAKSAQSGKLLTSATRKVATPIVEQATKTTTKEALKGIAKKTLVRSTVGATTGYGYDVAGNLQQDKQGASVLKPGGGTLLGGTIPLAIGGIEAAKAVTKSTAPRIINSLVKPKQADFSYGKNPGRTVSQMGITGNNMDDFANNIGKARQDVGGQIGAIYSSPANSGLTINAQEEIQKIDKAMATAAKGGKNNQGMVTTLSNLKDSLFYDHTVSADGTIVRTSEVPKDFSKLSPQQTFDLKQKVAEATQFTGRPSDDKTVNSVLKDVYGGLKEQLNSSVGKNNPEINSLNQKYADLTSAEIATRNRDKIVQRANLVSLKSGGAGAVATAVTVLSGGAALPAVLVGIGGATLEKALETAAVKTRVAAWLGSESPGVIKKVLAKNPAIKTVLYRALPKVASRLSE